MGNKSRNGISIPRQIPIFPLPNVILFPEVELPIYIFEPCYRMLLADCAASHKFLGVSLFRQGWEGEADPPPCHDIIGVGYIRAIFENPDGTSHVVIKGIGRAKILSYAQLEPYRIAQIRELNDRISDAEEIKRLAQAVKRLLAKKLRFASERPQDRLRFPKELQDPITLSHIASFCTDTSPYLKQDLLEISDTNNRLKYLIDILREEINPPENQN